MTSGESPVHRGVRHADEKPHEVAFGAPSVAVVAIVSHPGPWFDASLRALAKSDYPNLTVFVLEIGTQVHRRRGHLASHGDTAARVREAMPNAYFRTLRRHPGYSAAANLAVEVLGSPEYVIFAHDDVAPEPSTISEMVKRAERDSANVVMPKYVDWNEPTMVRSVGGRFDATGKYVPVIETPELDQGQHDSRHAVMAAEGGFVLVRTSFFNTLGGFDHELRACGEVLDFSWRAATAGTQVEVVASSPVRYLDAHTTPSRNVHAGFVEGDFEGEHSRDETPVFSRRNRARMVLKAHSGFQFLVVLGLQLLVVVGELIWGFVTGRRVMTTAALATVTWNVAHWRSLIRAKRLVERNRTVEGKVLRRSYDSVRRRWSEELQFAWEQRSARLAKRDFGRDLSRAGRTLRRIPVLLSIAIIAILIIGSRNLLSGPIAAVGQFMPLDDPVTSLRRFFLAWPALPMGESVPASPAHLILAAVEFLFLGATVLAQKVLIVGAIPFGVWSMVRLARPLHTSGAAFIAATAYALVPVPYEAIGGGRFDVLVAYALAPMIVHRLLRLDGADPYEYWGGIVHVGLRRRREDQIIQPLEEGQVVQPSAPRRRASDQRDELSYVVLRRVIPLGALIAVAGAFSPQLLTGLAVVGMCLAATRFPLGSIAARRLLAVGFGALVLAVLMLLPAILGNEGGLSQFWATHTDPPPLSTTNVLFLALERPRFAWVVLGIGLAALVSLVIGRAWRFQLAARLWFVTLTLMLLTWLGSAGVLGAFAPFYGVWFVLIAVFLSLAAATSVASLVYDRMKSPPWWRALGIRIFITVCVGASIIPLAFRSSNGQWGLPSTSVAATTSWMQPGASAPLASELDADSEGSFRTVWLGPSDVIPGDARNLRQMRGSITYNGPIGRSPAPIQEGGAGQRGVGEALEATVVGQSVDLGSRLAPYGVRYLAIPMSRDSVYPNTVLDDAQRLSQRMNQQLDMRQVAGDSDVRVWENIEWKPVVPAQLQGDNHSSWRGELDSGRYEVLTASSPSWQMRLDDRRVPRSANIFGNTYEVEANGSEANENQTNENVRLDFVAPRGYAIGQVMVATLWTLVFGTAIAYLPRRRQFA